MCQPLRISSEIKMDSQNPASRLSPAPITQQSKTKSTFRLSPFRKIAKNTRINLNRYWGLLSKLSVSKSSNIDALYAEEIKQNRINELVEAQILASSQNSINSQVEEFYYRDFTPISSGYGSPILSNQSITSTPPPARKLIKPTPVFVNCSCSSSHSEYSMDFDETSSQDSLFL